jgi:hypothetical protein
MAGEVVQKWPGSLGHVTCRLIDEYCKLMIDASVETCLFRKFLNLRGKKSRKKLKESSLKV